jgi:hypothetical protein
MERALLDQSIFMFADKNEAIQSVFQSSKIVLENIPSEWMDGVEILRIDKNLAKPGCVGFQGVKQLMGGGSIEIAI